MGVAKICLHFKPLFQSEVVHHVQKLHHQLCGHLVACTDVCHCSVCESVLLDLVAQF